MNLYSDYGRKAMFLCQDPGTYMAYFQDAEIDESELETTEPFQDGTADRLLQTWGTRKDIAWFDLSQRVIPNNTNEVGFIEN